MPEIIAVDTLDAFFDAVARLRAPQEPFEVVDWLTYCEAKRKASLGERVRCSSMPKGWCMRYVQIHGDFRFETDTGKIVPIDRAMDYSAEKWMVVK